MKPWRTIFTLIGWLALSAADAATFTENFSSNPAANGWQVFGNANLFQWDSTNHNLRVTWDSSQANSYFHRPLGTILTRDDDFQLSFDLTFEDYAGGVRPGKPYAFPAAIGFLNLDNASHTNFSRGAGINATYGPRNLVEFTFFPAFDVFLPTIAQIVISTNNTWLYNHDNLREMTPGEMFRVTMNYAAATQTLTTTVSNNAAQYGEAQTIVVTGSNFDFRVATLSISSYSDVRSQDSILAHGVVDNLTVVTPPSPVENLAGGFVDVNWRAQFTSRSNWNYVLERTTDLATWTEASTTSPGTGATLMLADKNPPADHAGYRVRANRP